MGDTEGLETKDSERRETFFGGPVEDRPDTAN